MSYSKEINLQDIYIYIHTLFLLHHVKRLIDSNNCNNIEQKMQLFIMYGKVFKLNTNIVRISYNEEKQTSNKTKQKN